jgi:ubiquinone/menaquinone biosynthesis C-methylase UbiE
MDWDPVTHYQEIEVAERYDRERFSRLTGRMFDALEKHNIAKAIGAFPPGGTVLDLPCGTGRLAEVLLDAGHRVVGVDISPAMLEVAKRKLTRFGDRFSTQVMDVMTLPADAQPRFDAALCARVLMHFPLDQQIRFLAGVTRLTRGPVVITQSLSTPYHRTRRRIKRAIGNPPSAVYPITNAELRQLLAGAGLREVRRLRPSRLITEEVIVVAERV